MADAAEARENFDDLAREDLPPQDPPADPPAEPSAEDAAWTSRAQRMGWVPQAEWRGDPAKWRPAREFVERAENNTPILITQIRNLDQKLEASQNEAKQLRGKVEDLSGTLERLFTWSKKADERAYKQARADLEEQRRAAAAGADVARVDAISQQIDALDEGQEAPAAPPARPAPPADPPAPAQDPQVAAWVSQQAHWFQDPSDEGREMNATAIALFGSVQTTRPQWTVQQRLDEVLRRIKVMYPDRFRNPRRNDPSAVLEPTNGAPSRKKGFTFDDLPAEAKKECDRFVRDIKGYTRDAYVKEWKRQEGIA